MTVVELPDGVLCREESAQICRDRLLASEGIAVDLSTGFMADALLDGRVVPVLPGWHRPARKLTVATCPQNAADPAVKALMTVLCGYAADQSGISSWSFWYRRFGIPLETVKEYAELKLRHAASPNTVRKTVPSASL
ncbi:MAG: hypothetical protein J6K46_02830 [Sutterella sp.]|nr:hypothetical protein [Sutterella sp.]